MVEIAARTAPPLGTINPGNLYVDLGTRTLWLGVDASVDALGAVLIADHEGTLDAIDACLVSAKTYVNEVLAGTSLEHPGPAYAPLVSPVFTGNPRVPTQTPGDNDTSIASTAFVQAALAGFVSPAASGWSPGMITIWGGGIEAIGTGDLAHWHACNGDDLDIAIYPILAGLLGTLHVLPPPAPQPPVGKFRLPDLRERFIVGAGTSYKVPGTRNDPGVAAAVTKDSPAHIHTIQNTTLALTQIPAHTHADGTLAGSTVATYNTGLAGVHTHPITAIALTGAGGPAAVASSFSPSTSMNTGGAAYTGTGASGADHFHDIPAMSVTITGNTGSAGSTGAHGHGMDGGGGIHTHEILPDVDIVPFYALCYMIRLD